MKVYQSLVIDVPVDIVWQFVKPYDSPPNWNPGVVGIKIEGGDLQEPGTIRHLEIHDDTIFSEELVELSEENRSYTYKILSCPLAISNYQATMSFLAITEGNKTLAIWESEFDCASHIADEMQTYFSHIVYEEGLNGIAERLAGKKNIRDTMYSKNTLDKMNQLRGDELLHDSLDSGLTKKYLLISDSNIIVKKNADSQVFFTEDELDGLVDNYEQRIFLGANDQTYYFALSLSDFSNNAYELLNAKEFSATNLVPDDEMGIIAQTVSTLNWNKRHQFCGQCGAVTESAFNGWRRDCTSCQLQHFPRVDSVVIMLVTRGDYCLLGSGADFSENRYSCLAGFMEPGETIEDAAARELYEEAGIKGKKAHYLTSQPWPFPFSLMIGVHIETNQEAITLDQEELRDAKWVNKSDVKAVLMGDMSKGFTLPPEIAIAHTLLSYWVNH